MAKININAELCTNCNFCVEVCPKKIFSKSTSKIPIIINEENCIECGHCLAICPVDAIIYPSFSKGEVIGKVSKDFTDLETFLASIRSVRNFKDRAIESGLIENLIQIASLAPAASNWRDVEYIVISDKNKINELEYLIIEHFKKVIRIFNPFVRFILSFTYRRLYDYSGKIIPNLKNLVKRSLNGENPVFHNSSCLILLYSSKTNRLAKDNCDAQVHYLRIAAHANGLGSCIIGYAISSHKILEKYLHLDKGKQVYSLLTLGYPKNRYLKKIIRKPNKVILN